MSNQMKLELVLLGKDLLGKILGKDIGFLKQFKKEGEAAAKAADKLHNAKKKISSGSSASKGDVDTLRKRTSETNKAAAAQEKYNNAVKREPKRGGGRRGGGSGGNSFEQDLLQGGTGAGMLWTASQGITSAMSKQEGLTDLYNAFYRSSLGAAELNSQMREGEKIADMLGNKLPGTTADYLQMFAVMKQRGIEADSILKGAGKSAAYLATANKEDRLDTGSNMARFGQMFDLKTENEYMGAADLMSRAKTTYGIGSAELMEAIKDFSGRTGKGLGLEGQKGAEDTLRYLAFLRAKTGMEGLTVGTSASSFFGQYLQAKEKKKDPTAELKKLTGVDLQVFDKKGKFLGLENAVKEFSKLKGKLSDEQMVGFGSKIAGEEGSAVFQAMVKNGDQFTQFNQDMTEAASLQEKSAKNAENLTNKVEALTGSLSNLGAAGFGPLVEPLGKIADSTNSVVGSLTDMAKAYPTSAATTAGVLSLGGAFLALKGGSGVLSRLTNMTALVGDNAASSTKKVGGLGKSLGSLPTALKIALTIEMLGIAWEQFEKLRETVDRWKETNKGLDSAGQQSYKAQQSEDETLKQSGGTANYKERAQGALSLLEQGNKEFSKTFNPKLMGWGEDWTRWLGKNIGGSDGFALFQGWNDERNNASKWNRENVKYEKVPGVGGVVQKGTPLYDEKFKQLGGMSTTRRLVDGLFKSDIERVYSEIAGVKNLQNRVPMLNDPNTMKSFRQDVVPTLGLSDIKKQFLEQMLSQAFPQSFAQSTQQIAIEQAQLSIQTQQLNQSFMNLQQPTTSLVDQFSTLNTNSGNAVTGVGNLANAVNNAASRINNVQITPPSFAPIGVPGFGQNPNPVLGGILGRAKGGSVTPGHQYRINEVGQEFFTPAASGSMVGNDVLRNKRRGAGAVHINFNPTVNVNSDNPNSEAILRDVRRELAILKREMETEFSPDRLAQRVEYAAQRDSERL